MPFVKCDECGADLNVISVQCNSCGAETEAFKKHMKTVAIRLCVAIVLMFVLFFLIVAGRP
jgi:hypothetical protein